MYQIGQKVKSTREYTQDDVLLFANLTMDVNPIHIDSEYAAKTFFGKTIVHGMFVASQISALLANKLPGWGTIYLGQDLKFLKPVFMGDKITCELEIISIDNTKNRAVLSTKCFNQDGHSVIEGTATVKLP